MYLVLTGLYSPEYILAQQRLGRLTHGAFQRGWIVLIGAYFTFPFLPLVACIAHLLRDEQVAYGSSSSLGTMRTLQYSPTFTPSIYLFISLLRLLRLNFKLFK